MVWDLDEKGLVLDRQEEVSVRFIISFIRFYFVENVLVFQLDFFILYFN